MKQLLLFLLAAFSLIDAAQAVSVSGTVTYNGSSSPVVGKRVYLIDSNQSTGALTIADSAMTSSTGAYTMTLTTSGTGVWACKVRTWVCTSASESNYGWTNGSTNITLNFSVACGVPAVTGTAYYSGWGVAPNTTVVLLDSSFSAGIVYRDTVTTNASGIYTFHVPTTITSGLLRIYAIGNCGFIASTGYVSYAGTSLSISTNLNLYCNGYNIRDTFQNAGDHSPVYGLTVYLRDSGSAANLDSMQTLKDGTAWFYVSPNALGRSYELVTSACGTQSWYFTVSGSMTLPTRSVCVRNTDTISGTITNASTSAAVAHYFVQLLDTSNHSTFYDSTSTDAAGHYSFPLPVNRAFGNISVFTQACGAFVDDTGTFTGGNQTRNLSICSTNTNTFSGIITNTATSGPLANHMVYISDTLTPHVYRDSMLTNSSGAYSFTIAPAFTSGLLRVSTLSCGALQSQSRFYMGNNLVAYFTVNPATPGLFSGVLYHANGTAAVNTRVVLNSYSIPADSLTDTTDSYGAYSFVIPCHWTAPRKIQLITYAPGSCGRVVRDFLYNGANISHVDTLCYAANYGISGTVRKQGGGIAANAKVWLITESLDSTTTPYSTVLSAIDSTVTNASGRYYFGRSTMLYDGIHVKAALQPADPDYANFLPTYADSSLSWSSAFMPSTHIWSQHKNDFDISLRGGTNPGGPGFIGGNVLLGANKQTAVGDPLSGRTLLLTDAAGNPVAYTYSDASGMFSFGNLPLQSYLLFGDAWGKSNPPLSITLSAGSDSVTNVVFEENSTTFQGFLSSTAVAENAALKNLRLFPNPAGDRLFIGGLSAISGAKTVVIRDIAGARVSSQQPGPDASVDTKSLPAGVYLLQLQTERGTGNFRFVKQ